MIEDCSVCSTLARKADTLRDMVDEVAEDCGGPGMRLAPGEEIVRAEDALMEALRAVEALLKAHNDRMDQRVTSSA